MVYLLINLERMISFKIVIMFALFSFCAGEKIEPRIKLTTKTANGVINYTHPNQEETWMQAENVYAFTVRDIEGYNIPMSIYKGKMLLILNVASHNTLTGLNYKAMNRLHKRFTDRGLVVLAFPCNQFGNEEPGTNAEIAEFAKKRKIQFPMFSKIEVNGPNASPLWKYMKYMTKGDEDIFMSFTKFIVDRNGHVLRRISTSSVSKVEKAVAFYFMRPR